MLRKAVRNEQVYGYLLRSTAGVMFLGTPLRGTKAASQAQWLGYTNGLLGKETSETILSSLEDNNSHLHDITEDFATLAKDRRLPVRCFYETRATNIVRKVLPKRIADIFRGDQVSKRDASSSSATC